VADMRVHAFVDEGLGHSSYVMDLGDGTAAVVDPPRFTDAHERLAADLGLGLAWTIDTHSHADYVTGSPGLARRRGIAFVAPAAARLLVPHTPLSDGDHVPLAGDLALVAVATPGHTPDHHAYVIERRGEPVALFSGGSLMVGTVGRTDLCGPTLAEPLAHDMFHSLQRFDRLPDDLALYPTHGAGSFCSTPGSAERTSTLGAERATNPLLQLSDEDEFVTELLAGFGTFPSYFTLLPELNRRGPTCYDAPPELAELIPDDVDNLVASGAVVIDARPIERFASSQIPGSISNALRPVFGNEKLAGVLVGGVDAWRASGGDVTSVGLVGAARLREDLVDVRQAHEFEITHVPGARNVELGDVAATDFATPVFSVMCGHGERAMTAASLLTARGYDVNVYDGGPETWSAETGQPLLTGR
jgi:glyoxylase-like metal-dependent hydrolase (beta-lactamase superfamily II)/rhodanese-related sulfurtransferase